MDISILMMRLSQISVLVPLVIGALKLSKLSGAYRSFYVYIILCALMEAITAISVYFVNNNFFIIHFFMVVEFILLSFVFWEYFSGDQNIRKMIIVFILIFLVTFIYHAPTVGEKFDSVSRSLEAFFLIVNVLTFFGLSISRHQPVPIWKQPFFWISTGVLVYFSLTLFFFMAFNIIKLELDLKNVGILHSSLNLLSYLFYAQAFRCFR